MSDTRHYVSPEWLELRARIVTRDGHCCRNCGFGDQLEVHHWLPLPEDRSEVDHRGYGLGDNPLLVPESGLITLCRRCHEALTKTRTEQAILRNPSLQKLSAPGSEQLRNVFELWALNGKQLPFRIIKETWNAKVSQFYLVEKVEIGKWPYGHAWGRYCRDGEMGEPTKIPNAGTYTWRLFEAAEPSEVCQPERSG